jgi:hypothetical protein
MMTIAWSRRTRQSLPVDITASFFGVAATFCITAGRHQISDRVLQRYLATERNIKMEVGKDIMELLGELEGLRRIEELEGGGTPQKTPSSDQVRRA